MDELYALRNTNSFTMDGKFISYTLNDFIITKIKNDVVITINFEVINDNLLNVLTKRLNESVKNNFEPHELEFDFKAISIEGEDITKTLRFTGLFYNIEDTLFECYPQDITGLVFKFKLI